MTEVLGEKPCDISDGSCALLRVRRLPHDLPPRTSRRPSQQEQDDPENSFSMVFSTRRPRDAIAGTVSGIKTFTRSCAAGTGALIYGPVLGARDDGVIGGVRGLGAGITAAAVLPCVGAVVGLVQCARGILATPIALIESAQGYGWSDKDRCWALSPYSISKEIVLQQTRRAKSGNCCVAPHGGRNPTIPRPPSLVVDGTYYSILGVPLAATDREIRLGYYKASRLYHPDKVGGGPAAVERFQVVSEAYQVLKSHRLRRIYDAKGRNAALRETSNVDWAALHGVALGSKRWEPYVGQLALSRALERDEGLGVILMACPRLLEVDAELEQWQTEREVSCAVALAARLGESRPGPAWEHELRAEMGSLTKTPFALEFLEVVGRVYEHEALTFLGVCGTSERRLWCRGEAARFVALGRSFQHQTQAATAVCSSLLALRNVAAEAGGCAAEDATTAPPTPVCLEHPAVRNQLPLFLRTLWRLTILDVEQTLMHVCRRVLRDASVDLSVRRERAESMLFMGEILGGVECKAFAEDDEALKAYVEQLLQTHH